MTLGCLGPKGTLRRAAVQGGRRVLSQGILGPRLKLQTRPSSAATNSSSKSVDFVMALMPLALEGLTLSGPYLWLTT